MRRLAAALVVILLAACQQESPPAGNAAANSADDAAGAKTPVAKPGATPTAPALATIPARFRGVWAEDRAACAQLSHPSRLIISESVIRFPSFALVGEGVDRPADSSFAIKGHNQRTGAPADAHYSIDATDSMLTDEAGGGAVRVRCA